MKYENIFQFAIERKISAATHEEAYYKLLAHAEKVYNSVCKANQHRIDFPYYRFNESTLQEYVVRILGMEYSDDVWSATHGNTDIGAMKKLARKARWQSALKQRGDWLLHLYELMPLDEAEALAEHDIKAALRNFQFLIMRMMKSEAFGFAVHHINVQWDDTMQAASYYRGSLNLKVSSTVLGTISKVVLDAKIDNLDLVMNDYRKAIVLHFEKACDTAAFVRYATKPGKRYPLTMMEGAFYDGQLVPGYRSPEDVRANLDTIAQQAHVLKVTQALLQK